MNKCFTHKRTLIFERGLIIMHQMTQYDQAKTTPFISAVPTVARKGVNSLLVSGLPVPDSTRLEESILDRILLAYRKYLQYGSAEAKSKHDEGDFSDGGHFVIPLCYNCRFTPEGRDRVQLHIEFWLSTCPAPYISAGVPLPESAKPDDVFDKWMQEQGKLQMQRINQGKNAEDKNTKDKLTGRNFLSSCNRPALDPEIAEIDLLWHERELSRALAQRQRQLKNKPQIPAGYRPMVIQEVMPLFEGYLEALKTELEIFFQHVYQDAINTHTAPDYYGFNRSYIPTLNIKPTLCQ